MLASVESACFGSQLRQHRHAAGLTQAALARRVGLSERTIQDLERGVSRPRHETALRLQGALSVTPGLRAHGEPVVAATAETEPERRHSPFGPDLPGRLPSPVTSFVGRAREQQVATLVGQGLTNQQIAAALVLSRRTVEWHIGNLLEKLGVRARAQLVAWAAGHGAPRALGPALA